MDVKYLILSKFSGNITYVLLGVRKPRLHCNKLSERKSKMVDKVGKLSTVYTLVMVRFPKKLATHVCCRQLLFPFVIYVLCFFGKIKHTNV